MAKKRKKRTQKKRKNWLVPKKQVKEWLNLAANQLIRQDYAAMAQTCKRILRYTPHASDERVQALEYLATAYMMLQQFEAAYQTLSKVLAVNPDQGYLWYNRGLTGRYTMRLVQATHDFEKAIELETDPQQRNKVVEILAQTRQLAESERALRGPDFTLDQLLEQQDLFSQGTRLMHQEKWAEAEQTFRRVIEMGDCLPQPQGNLGVILLMQEKYDEAEAALKRALEIEPDYDLARRNLAALPRARQGGELPDFLMRESFADAKVNLTMRLID